MENIINQVKNNWSKDLTIRFLYIKLAPYFQRDLFYFLATEEEKMKQYKQGFVNRFPYINCSTLSDFYIDLFKRFGIRAKKVMASNDKIPLFAILVEGDFGWYFLSPINDLFSNQYGLKPYFFGIIPRYKELCQNHSEIKILPPEYVEELDRTLDIHYLDNFFSHLHKIFTEKKAVREFFGFPKDIAMDFKGKKLQFYNNELINLGNVPGPFERSQLYKYLNDQILNKGEKRFTKVKLVGGFENCHVSLTLINHEEITSYEEEKIDGKYVLIKKR